MPQKESTHKPVVRPQVRDYLPASISRAVTVYSLSHPMTVYPVAGGAACGVVGLLFGMPVFYLAALAGLLAGPLWAGMLLSVFRHRLAGAYLEKLNTRRNAHALQVRSRLLEELKKGEDVPDLAPLARQGIHHFHSIDDKLSSVEGVLQIKLNPGEMTYNRFVGAAETACLSVLDNLSDIAGLMKSAVSIDLSYLQNRLSNSSFEEGADPERRALEERLQLYESQKSRIQKILARNETALTELEKISAAVAEWRDDDRFASVEFESAIKRLQELAEQAGDYGTVHIN